jgi:SAM-dependent methyltransferase
MKKAISRSAETKSRAIHESGLSLVPPRTRPRDLLKLTAFPIHPFDQMHGVDTSGLVPAAHLVTGHPNDEHVTAYYGVAPSILRALIERWRETPPVRSIGRFSFIDIGAGKGRAMLVASELGFRQVVGIELNPVMAAVARANVERWRESHSGDRTAPKLSPIAVIEQDALDYEFPPTPALLFLFHPFEAPVMKLLLRRIETQFAKRPGQLDILYVNAECAHVLDRNPAFEQLFLGPVAMSPEDHAADLEAIARQREYGSTGDEECAIYRYVGRATSTGN